jgi:4-hydroxybenzoate polyprenyltransferase
MLNQYLILIRPKSWVKNIIIVIPFLLGKKFNSIDGFNILIGIVSFSLMSSVCYILNDIVDIDIDRQHVIKKYRPLANATVNINNSILFAIILFITSLFLCYIINKYAVLILLFYFILNYTYTNFIKHIRFIDIIILSSFYILRVIYGSYLVNVTLSGWFVSTLTMIVLSLSINKRYLELKVNQYEKLPGRNYHKDDEMFLYTFMINFSIAALLLLNIHAYFVLQIQSYLFYCFINLIIPAIIFYYFDNTHIHSDDPVEKILKNKRLLFFTVILLVIYYFEILYK